MLDTILKQTEQTTMSPRTMQGLLSLIRTHYPKQVRSRNGRFPHAALTGWIPVEVFEEHQVTFDQLVEHFHLKVIYRGPRVQNESSYTRKADATHVVLYHK